MDTASLPGAEVVDQHGADDPTAFVLGGSGGLRRRSQGAFGTWLGIAIVGVLVAIPLRGLYRFTGGTMEEGFMLYFPELIARGDVPNVDFLHLYGPGSLHVLTGWYELFGYSLPAERTFGLLQHLGIIFALFALARAWGRAAATAVGAFAVFYVMTPVALTAMAWNGGLALTLWSAVFALRASRLGAVGRGRNWWIAAGVLAGLALSFRPDLVIAVGLVFGWLLWRSRPGRRPALLGAVIGLLPIWVHLIMAGPVSAFEGMVLDPVFRLRDGRELPRPPPWDHLDGALQAVAEEIPPWWKFPALSASHTIFVWFFVMLLGTAAMVAFAIWNRRRAGPTGRATVLLAVSLVSVGILPQALQRPDSAHLLWVTCVAFPFSVATVAELVARFWPTLDRRRAVAIGGAFTLVLTFAVTALFTFRYYLLHTRIGLGQVASPFRVERGDRYFYLGDREAYLAVQAAVDQLDGLAEPGDRLLVGPERPAPHLVQRRVHLLAAARARTGDVLHRDGPRPGQRRGFEPRRRCRLRRLGAADRPVGRLDRAQLIRRLRLRRAEPGPARRVLRRRHVGGRPGHPLLPKSHLLSVGIASQRSIPTDRTLTPASDATPFGAGGGTR